MFRFELRHVFIYFVSLLVHSCCWGKGGDVTARCRPRARRDLAGVLIFVSVASIRPGPDSEIHIRHSLRFL
jgi:hypothetical protein